VLRYGAFYGPDTGMFDAALIEQIRGRRVPLIGGGGAWWSFLQIDDAAEANRPGGRTRRRRLQYRRRRSCAGSRMASRDRCNAPRKAAVPRARMGRSPGGRPTPRRYDDAIARGIERQGEAGTQLASPSSFLAAGIR
jgi:nucleoside-diphosphate-sugar epimerase